jgi:hypothetical protein
MKDDYIHKIGVIVIIIFIIVCVIFTEYFKS